MKQETKELLDYIISQFNTRQAIFDGMPEDEKAKAHIYNCRQDKIQDFLNSIPEIESKLCRGGYIQDKNGTPCCDGDKILFCGEYNGVLRFGFIDDNDKNFMVTPHFWFDFGGVVPTISGSIYFEKVE